MFAPLKTKIKMFRFGVSLTSRFYQRNVNVWRSLPCGRFSHEPISSGRNRLLFLPKAHVETMSIQKLNVETNKSTHDPRSRIYLDESNYFKKGPNYPLDKIETSWGSHKVDLNGKLRDKIVLKNIVRDYGRWHTLSSIINLTGFIGSVSLLSDVHFGIPHRALETIQYLDLPIILPVGFMGWFAWRAFHNLEAFHACSDRLDVIHDDIDNKVSHYDTLTEKE